LIRRSWSINPNGFLVLSGFLATFCVRIGPVGAMAHRLKMPEGRTLYALRKQTPKPVFEIIKSVMGFRQFLLHGLDNIRGEWSLVIAQFSGAVGGGALASGLSPQFFHASCGSRTVRLCD
jgi:hypothetical protein